MNATTLLAQLGGSRFVAMTGARNFVSDEDSVLFAIGRGALKGINVVKITLEADDTYTLRFLKISTRANKMIDRVDGVFADDLRARFTDATGFYTSL